MSLLGFLEIEMTFDEFWHAQPFGWAACDAMTLARKVWDHQQATNDLVTGTYLGDMRRAAALAWVALADIRDLHSEDWNGHAAIEAIEAIEVVMLAQSRRETERERDAKRYAALRVLGVEFSGYKNDTVYRVCLEALDDATDLCMLDMPPNAELRPTGAGLSRQVAP